MRRVTELLLLSALAFLINWNAPVIFFDLQVMLGGSLAVFAVLRFGWAGLMVGTAALSVTMIRWGHPIEWIVGTGFLTWLKFWSDRGGDGRRDNGRVVTAAAIYWLVVGLPAEVVLFNRFLGLDIVKGAVLGLKESCVGVINAALGLLLHLIVSNGLRRRTTWDVPARGLSMAVVLSAVALPGALITCVMSRQMAHAILADELHDLVGFGKEVIATSPDARQLAPRDGMEYDWRVPGGDRVSSSPSLFDTLEESFRIESPNRTGVDGLGIYTPVDENRKVVSNARAYWFTRVVLPASSFDPEGKGAAGSVTVVRAADEMITRLGYRLVLPTLTILMLLILTAVACSEVVGWFVRSQFHGVTAHFGTSGKHGLPMLRSSRIRELNAMTGIINERRERIHELRHSLEDAEFRQREAAVRTSLTLQNLPIAVMWVSCGDVPVIEYTNGCFSRMFGDADAGQVTLEDWFLRTAEDPAECGRLLEAWRMRSGEPFPHAAGEARPVRLRDKCGSIKDTLISIVFSDDSMLLSISDISALRSAEMEIRSMRGRLEKAAFELTENIPIGTYTMVLDAGSRFARFSFLSKRFLELTGLDRDAVLADPMIAFDCVHPEERADWIRKNQETFEHRLPFKEEARIVANGEVRWMIAESSPRPLPDGGFVWEGVLTDITERRRAEAGLAAREAELATILENIPVPIAINELGPNPTITFLNRAFLRLFGYEQAELRNFEDWAVRAYPDPAYRHEVMKSWARALDEASRQGRVVNAREYTVCCGDGAFKEVLINAVLLDRMAVVGFVDITESKRSAERRRQLEETHRKQLEVKLKSSLAASAVAHEINQPLSVILLTGRIAMMEQGTERAALERIVSEAGRVAVTIEKMKALLRNVETEHQWLSLESVVRSSVTYNHPLFLRHQIEVAVSSPAGLPPILGDEVQLQIAITNLLRNAVEAIGLPASGQGRVSIELRHTGDIVELVIGDNGPGWSGMELEEDPLCSDKPGGTGIGLFIVRTTMRNHRGSIAFGRSSMGGAEIRLEFPRRRSQPEDSEMDAGGERDVS